MTPNLQKRVSEFKQQVAAGNLAGVVAQYGDLLLVACIACMVGLMIVPLPTWLLDIFLTINITGAVIILMVSIYISSPVEIFSFPTLLLVTTLYRLSLDISATRLILLQADAGSVIQSFGQFVVHGNFVVGAVIFLIITLVQFIVITKGAERVAEVGARFTLDAMPGKQMSIDADMRAGILSFADARTRRAALGRESQFYGAMDGAMKFVKGDAIAGIVITLINIIGGLIIGVAMHGMSVADAVQTYSVLTIGQGLVSQIPALLISISAGMVVTRIASEAPDSNLGRDITGQLLAQPRAIAVASGLLLLLGIIPGMPKVPFFLLAGATGSLSYGLFKADARRKEIVNQSPPAQEMGKDPAFTMTVPLLLQVDRELTPFVDVATDNGRRFLEMLKQVRRSLYFELGVMYPPIQVSGNNPLAKGYYQIWLNESPLVSGQIRTDALMVNDSAANIAIFGIKGEDTKNPATGKPAAWIPRSMRPRAEMAGLQIWDAHGVLTLHLTTFLRKHAREFMGIQEARWLTEQLKRFYPALVDEVAPKPVSFQLLSDVMRRLVDEGVSIRDLRTIFQCLAEIGHSDGDVVSITETVRSALKHKLCFQLSGGGQQLFVYQLDPDVEDMVRNSIRQGPNGAYLGLDSQLIQQVIEGARVKIGNLPATAQKPVILTDGDIRRYVKKMLDYNFPELSVISYDQLTPQINVHALGVIAMQRALSAVE
jgi:type III secretion protein V